MNKLTPMMQQYVKLKEEYPDALLFFRLGDFYELFFDDAITAARELEITLTARDCGQEEKAAMCGVPHHSATSYLDRLVEKGYKVAICEQMEDPSQAKGIVKRDVVRVITPGTLIDTKLLDEKSNNYLLSMYLSAKGSSLSYVDISTGEFYTTEYLGNDEKTLQQILDETLKIQPKEIIYYTDPQQEFGNGFSLLLRKEGFYSKEMERKDVDSDLLERRIKQHFHVDRLDTMGFSPSGLEVLSAGMLIDYLKKTQKRSLSHINEIMFYSTSENMTLDYNTRRNLELTETIQLKRRKGSLLWVIDKTATAMGGRLLRKWIEEPLIKESKIRERLNTVEYFKEHLLERQEMDDALKNIYDLERLTSKIGYDNANPRDLISLKSSISHLPKIKAILESSRDPFCQKLLKDFDLLSDVWNFIEEAVLDDPSIGIKDGNIIKETYNDEVKELRLLSTEGHKWMTALEEQERQHTGIKSLKVKYNRVFGYFIDITRSNLHLVPEHYIRKQTLANSERYVTSELKEMESKILGAEEKITQLEYHLFLEVREVIKKEISRIQKTAKAVATIDVLKGFAQIAVENDYIKPRVLKSSSIEIKGGRHPVVERMFQEEDFIPNDTHIDHNDKAISIITGPNMAGKSTYMRQVALISLMAQIGCFVPASEATIGIVDRIFTRVGASDDLSQGKSTFMVEMTEMAHILNHATDQSLLILDEIGRGTSTFDGLSIAWAILEEISCHLKAKTLFSTHYHELTSLSEKLVNVENYQISVKEEGEDIIFLRKVIKGSADKSYGIQVARLAGLPKSIINNANRILNGLEEKKDTNKIQPKPLGPQQKSKDQEPRQLDFQTFYQKQILDDVKKINLMETTPLDAMNYLFKLQQQVKKIAEENTHGKKSKNAR